MSNLIFVDGLYTAGVVLAVPVMTDSVGVVLHKGLLGDQRGADGFPTVIHNSKLYGMVLETTMTEFASRHVGPVRSDGHPGGLAAWQVLQRARSRIGQAWSVGQNCEHFTSWAHGLVPSSPQLQAGVGKAAVAAMLAAIFLGL